VFFSEHSVEQLIGRLFLFEGVFVAKTAST